MQMANENATKTANEAETRRYPLANDANGDPLELREDPVAWRVKETPEKAGRPRSIFDPDTGLENPLTSTILPMRWGSRDDSGSRPSTTAASRRPLASAKPRCKTAWLPSEDGAASNLGGEACQGDLVPDRRRIDLRPHPPVGHGLDALGIDRGLARLEALQVSMSKRRLRTTTIGPASPSSDASGAVGSRPWRRASRRR
jgi:hypothetical protein